MKKRVLLSEDEIFAVLKEARDKAIAEEKRYGEQYTREQYLQDKDKSDRALTIALHEWADRQCATESEVEEANP